MNASSAVLVGAGAVTISVLSYVAGRAQAQGPASTDCASMPDVLPRPAVASAATTEKRVVEMPSNTKPPPATCPKPEPNAAQLHPSDTIVAAADAFPDLLASWDAGVVATLFDNVDLDGLERELAWMRERVGRCGPPTPMGNNSESRGRFAYVCEQGVLEAEFAASDPDATTVSGMRGGVRDVEPVPEVSNAGETFTTLIDAWDPDIFEARFSDRFREKLGANMPRFAERLREELGSCELGPVDLAGPTGALFVLDCEHGRRTMVIGLDEGQRISGLKVVPLRRDPGD